MHYLAQEWLWKRRKRRESEIIACRCSCSHPLTWWFIETRFFLSSLLFLGGRSCIGFQNKWRSMKNIIILCLKIFKVWYQTPICWGDIWRWFEFSLCKYLGVLLLLLQWHFICSFQIPSSFCSWYCQEIYVKYMSECNDYLVSVELCV